MNKNAILSKNFKKLTFFATVLIVSLALGNFVLAVWTEPTATPPNNNAPAPINVSSNAQTKTGNLSVSTLYDTDNTSYYINPSATATPSGVFAGSVGIGTTAPQAVLHVSGDEVLIESDDSAEINFLPFNNLDDAMPNWRIGTDSGGNLVFSSMTGTDWNSNTTHMLYITPAHFIGIKKFPSVALDVNGTIKGTDYRSGDGSRGLTRNVTVKGSDGNNCILTFKDGLLTAETCP